jgi:putative hydrolase of the HAD superfamily
MEDRHHLTADTYEEGRLSLEDYLDRVVFYKERPFTQGQFRNFMFAQSKAFPQMIELIARLKRRYGLKTAAVSNEGRELNAHRIQEFKLEKVIDFFVCSCFVHIRKPDADMFRLALDFAQVQPREIVYIENTPMFVDIAEEFGIRSILHVDYPTTCAELALLGLPSADLVPSKVTS